MENCIFLESGKPCKKTYYDKNLIIDHVERFHTIHGHVGKICKVLINRKPKPEKEVPKRVEPTPPQQPPPPKKPKDVFRCTYCQYKDKSIDKLHVSRKSAPSCGGIFDLKFYLRNFTPEFYPENFTLTVLP